MQPTHQPPIITDHEVQGWKILEKNMFLEALLQSELCNPDQRPDAVEEYFNVDHNTLQSVVDEFAPVWRVAIRCQ